MKNILNYMYPPVCGFCNKINHEYLCKKCENQLNSLLNLTIIKGNKVYNEHLYFFKYNGYIREKILSYKFEDNAYLYKSFVKFMIKNEKAMEFFLKYDIIIPVPISKKRKKQRGYNQSELIAKEIVRQNKEQQNQLILMNNILLKKIDTTEQSKLNKEERILNSQGVYETKKDEVLRNKRILVVDDIFTTGSTVEECSRVLLKAKVKTIGVCTIARD